VGRRPKILTSFGTRPEAIKMLPVVRALQASNRFETRIVVTAQHREMLDQVLDIFDLRPDADLDLMTSDQTLDDLASRVLLDFGDILDRELPDRVLIHGDTLSTSMVALACYFRKIPVGHVEAGLRSGNIYSPWPEEVNRKIAGVISDLHFAPTEGARQALLAEAVDPETIYVTGNTVVDALLLMKEMIAKAPSLTARIDPLIKQAGDRRIIAVTAHRRESFEDGLNGIANAIVRLARRGDVEIIFPMHPNPAVAEVMRPALDAIPNVALIEPLDYPNFVRMMDASVLILTDSGGIQEEAPSFRTPVLVMRDTTERPEAVESGAAYLVGTQEDAIVAAATRLLDSQDELRSMADVANPFGDGIAAKRIVQILEMHHSGKGYDGS